MLEIIKKMDAFRIINLAEIVVKKAMCCQSQQHLFQEFEMSWKHVEVLILFLVIWIVSTMMQIT